MLSNYAFQQSQMTYLYLGDVLYSTKYMRYLDTALRSIKIFGHKVAVLVSPHYFDNKN